MSNVINFKTQGIRRPILEPQGTELVSPWMSGILYFDAKKFKFNDWEVSYSNIESAELNTSHNLSMPMNMLLIRDNNYNYMFKIPRKYKDITFPFEVQLQMEREVEGSLWQRYGLLILFIVVLLLNLIPSTWYR